MILKSILIVALSEKIGSNERNGMLLQSEIHLRNIDSIIKGTTIDEKDNYEKDNYSCDDYDEIIPGVPGQPGLIIYFLKLKKLPMNQVMEQW